MNHLLSRRAFNVGLAAGIPAILLGRTAASQSFSPIPDSAVAGLDLESIFQRISPYALRDRLMSTPVLTGEGMEHQVERWANVSTSPYFSTVGGVNVLSAAGGMSSETVLGAYGIYLAKAGALAGQYLGRRALEDTTTDVLAQDIGGYAAETLVYENGEGHSLTQVTVGNVMVLGFDLDASGQSTGDEVASVANATLLVNHLRQTFQAVA